MSYKIVATENFRKEAKRLIKKFKSLKNELSDLGVQLSENPNMGIPLGNNVFKIRIAIKSKGKGKRGGGRIITQIKIEKEIVYLVSIYSKGERNDIPDHELRELLQGIPSSDAEN